MSFAFTHKYNNNSNNNNNPFNDPISRTKLTFTHSLF